jgi:hypothetical protein
MTYDNPNHVGFIDEPKCGRGTAGLLWQCLSTVVLCIYTALHLDVPTRPMSSRLHFYRMSFWSLVGLLFPEMVCLKAVNDHWRTRQMMELLAEHKLPKPSIKQAHFLVMGGIRVAVTVGGRKKLLDNQWLASTRIISLCNDKHDPRARSFLHWLLEKLPTDEEIDEKSKADPITKLITCTQVIWVAIQICGRLVQHLDVSLLEVATSAYLVLTVATYILWLSKPYRIMLVTQVILPEAFHDAPFTSKPVWWVDEDRSFYEILRNDCWLAGTLQEDQIYGDYTFRDPVLLVVAIGLFTVFSGIHCAAWRYSFPSISEARLWRASAVTLGASSLLMGILTYGFHSLSDVGVKGSWILCLRVLVIFLMITSIAAHALARIAILVEVIISLRSAPAGIYQQVNWSAYIGHIGS